MALELVRRLIESGTVKKMKTLLVTVGQEGKYRRGNFRKHMHGWENLSIRNAEGSRVVESIRLRMNMIKMEISLSRRLLKWPQRDREEMMFFVIETSLNYFFLVDMG